MKEYIGRKVKWRFQYDEDEEVLDPQWYDGILVGCMCSQFGTESQHFVYKVKRPIGVITNVLEKNLQFVEDEVMQT